MPDTPTPVVQHPEPYEPAKEAFGRLLVIMDELRENCPWDRKQTLESIRHLTIEETYELSDAILSGDYPGLRGELGDLLLHIVFYSRIAREEGRFNITEVIHTLCDKLVRRHPHIYGQVEADSAEQVIQNWEQIKQQEKAGQERRSVLQGVPESMPTLLKAFRMQEKAAAVGFDWADPAPMLDKVQEELDELRRELAQPPSEERKAKAEAEFGDLLFSLVNYARFAGLNPEDALERTNRKFRRRFEYIEQQAEAKGRNLREMTLEEMDALWEASKNEE